MQIKISKTKINPGQLIKKCGYGEVIGRQGRSYVRRLGKDQFPRFHIYVENNFLNLHLDQKKAIYQGTTAHSGDYDSDLIKKEMARIKDIIKKY